MNYKKSKKKKIYNIASRLLLLTVAGSVVVGIILYSGNVKLVKHLDELDASIEETSADIANNKNVLYGLTDFQDLEASVLSLGLIRELNPNYLELEESSQLSYQGL